MELSAGKGLQVRINLEIKARSLAILFFVSACILLPAPPCNAQSCRPLEQKVLYEYDPSHQTYPDSAVVLKTARQGTVLSVVVSIVHRIDGNDQVQLLQSNDLGRHWFLLQQSNIATPLALAGNTFVEAPSDARVQYKYMDESGMYARSLNEGRTWTVPQNRIGSVALTEFVRTFSRSANYKARFSIAAVHPSKPLTLFATLRLEYEGKNGAATNPSIDVGLYRTDDGEEHWLRITDAVQYGSPLGVNPADPSIIFGYGKVGLLGVIKTTDAGATWSLTKQQKLREQRPTLLEEQRGASVLGVPTGIEVRQFAVDPGDPNTVYVVSTKGIYRSLDGGEKWCLLKTERDFLNSVYSLAFDPSDTRKIFVGTRFGVLYSDDQGEGFARIYPPSSH